jgi:hypothetical protein
MVYRIDLDLLDFVRDKLARRTRLYWVLGGAGAGKTTVCKKLSAIYSIPIYDMDAHIYDTYHARFVDSRHPVNYAWSKSANGLAWLLDMSPAEFAAFNKAALVEYLDLLAADLEEVDADAPLLIDGGASTMSVLLKVLPANRMVCLLGPLPTSREVWNSSEERAAMKAMVCQLPAGEVAWEKFLDFDQAITQGLAAECREHGVAILAREKLESVEGYAARVADALFLSK